MAYHSTEFDSGLGRFAHNLFGALRGVLSSIVKTMIVSSSYMGRVRKVQALQAKTDEELAAMNIKRDDIVHVVFHDLYYV
ncbi:hypothetical protein [Roseobacter sinensis]|uniref:DUF1127 domain-containing protein n=1 Tax=Roseobacter sinensis TaxID=2931391 RepID=A0ABT3B9Y2_9RHOB|nr:hypothetical protein [Roseobacter sp. WL0113]MCV3270371.1 hypothetical protein [Roseobacter sp. WL0113]